MKVSMETRQSVEVNLTTLLVHIPVDEVEYDECYEGDGRVPESFKVGDAYVFRVNVDTGRIDKWPEGLTVDAHYKPRDSGRYVLLSDNGGKVADFDDDYVPGFLDHNDGGGDYLDFKVGPDGKWDGLKLTAERIGTDVADRRNAD